MRIITALILFFTASYAMASADLFIYPSQGQDPELQRQDRYECHVWAAQQTGFDPSTYQAPQPVTYTKVSRGPGYDPHPGLNPVSGAAGGAALGAVGGAIGGDAGKGAAIGAGIGAVLGAFHTLKARDRRSGKTVIQAQPSNEITQLRNGYNRAISACLEGRGYTVK